jgi:hypothetical protein
MASSTASHAQGLRRTRVPWVASKHTPTANAGNTAVYLLSPAKPNITPNIKPNLKLKLKPKLKSKLKPKPEYTNQA